MDKNINKKLMGEESPVNYLKYFEQTGQIDILELPSDGRKIIINGAIQYLKKFIPSGIYIFNRYKGYDGGFCLAGVITKGHGRNLYKRYINIYYLKDFIEKEEQADILYERTNYNIIIINFNEKTTKVIEQYQKKYFSNELSKEGMKK